MAGITSAEKTKRAKEAKKKLKEYGYDDEQLSKLSGYKELEKELYNFENPKKSTETKQELKKLSLDELSKIEGIPKEKEVLDAISIAVKRDAKGLLNYLQVYYLLETFKLEESEAAKYMIALNLPHLAYPKKQQVKTKKKFTSTEIEDILKNIDNYTIFKFSNLAALASAFGFDFIQLKKSMVGGLKLEEVDITPQHKIAWDSYQTLFMSNLYEYSKFKGANNITADLVKNFFGTNTSQSSERQVIINNFQQEKFPIMIDYNRSVEEIEKDFILLQDLQVNGMLPTTDEELIKFKSEMTKRQLLKQDNNDEDAMGDDI